MKKILLKTALGITMHFLATTILLFLSSAMLIANNSDAQNIKEVEITLGLRNASLVETFKAIENQTRFKFMYQKNIKSSPQKVTIEVHNKSVAHVLKLIAQQTGLTFKQINNTLSVKEAVRKSGKKMSTDALPDREVSGKVINQETSEPLIGATVTVKKYSNIGTVTDVDGNFNLKVPDDAEALIFSYIGFTSMEVPLGNNTVFEVALENDLSTLSEVLVVGYGTGKRTEVNGAISKVSEEEVSRYATANFEQAILGTMAGVQISQNGRNPGEDSQISIRGISTLTAGVNPLIVVDGVPLTEGSSLSSINTQDIESISVLKDASSAAIYGSRASNGVIMITTKKGEQRKIKVNFDAFAGVQSRTDKLELINAYDAAQFFKEARDNGYVSRDPENRSIADDRDTRIANGANKRELRLGYTQPYLDGVQGLTDYDWLDGVYRNAHFNNYYVSVSGGHQTTNYFVSFGYLDQEGMVIGTGMDRYTSNIRLNTAFTDNLRFGINLNTSFADLDVTDDNGWNNLPPDPGSSFYLMYPFFNPYNEDGSFAISAQIRANTPEDGSLSENTIAMTTLTKNTESRFRTFGSTFLEYEPVKGLQIKTSIGADFRSSFFDYYQPSTFGRYRTDVVNNQSNSTETKTRIENYLIENTINYGKQVDNHGFKFLLGQSYQQEKFTATEVAATGIIDDNLDNISAGGNFTVDADRYKWTQLSYFGRLQYDYSGKYFLTAALRRDGSSRFGANSKWGTFSSFSAGWLISDEPFFPLSNIFNHAKLRVSWGQTGNNQIGSYSSQALVNEDNYTINGQLLSGFSTTTSPNPDLSWETNTSTNIGIDFGVLENKIFISAEYYSARTKDLLLKVPVPQQSGFDTSLQNIGELKNRGFEFELRGKGFKLGGLLLGFNTNLTANVNEVLALGADQGQIIASSGGSTYLTKIGEPIAQFYGWDIIGVYKTQEDIDSTPHLSGTLVGDYKVRDADGDGDVDSDDRVPLGTYNPDFTYAFGMNMAYKSFDLSLSFTGVEGRKVYDHLTARGLEVGEGFTTASQYYFDNYYHAERNPDGFFAAPNLGNFSSARRNTRMSSITVSDGDYFRLRNIQIGYTFPKSTLKAVGISRLRVYATANNLFTITKYRGLNSEGIRPGTLTNGYARSAGSIPRLIAGGLNVTF